MQDVVGAQLNGSMLATLPPATPLPDGPDGAQRFLLAGEGRCKIGLEVLPPLHNNSRRDASQGKFSKGNFPQGKFSQDNFSQGKFSNGSFPGVLYVSRKGGTLSHPQPGTLSAVERERVRVVRGLGLWVVLVDVCGFGTLGDEEGDAFGLFDLPTWDYR